MIRVGLTGGIGAGKSTVAKTFIERGAYHVDADKIAREVVAPGTPGLAQLVEAFGQGILDADGALDRPALAAKAFVDDESRQKLNGITHPLIGARTQELTDAAPADAIILHDVPLLVEGHMAPFYHLVAVVHADADVRFDRLTTLRGMDADDARARIAAQATDEQRRAVADVWLDNTGTQEALAAQALAVWNDRLIPLRDNVAAGVAAALPTEVVDYDPTWAALGARVVNRVWALVGGNAGSVTHVGPTATEGTSAVPVIDIAVTSTADVSDALAAGGFPSVEPGVHVSADPGRAVRIAVTPTD
ncbi:dephospho-CoA kinase [Gordonia spumicola]|uniref:dephospho-CoA kinase n=1 Tax=Gordonia spumicola TaxID=589161 RepID=UPI00164288D5|nr:dephospho-CoA kinase [Gordonia spumicola]